jgi:hypothetical protein
VVAAFAHVDGAAGHRQPGRGAQQPAQCRVGGLSGLTCEISSAFHRNIEEERRPGQLVDKHAGARPEGAGVLIGNIRRGGLVARLTGLSEDGQDDGGCGLAVVERMRIAQDLGGDLRARQPGAGRRCRTKSALSRSCAAASVFCRARRLRSPSPPGVCSNCARLKCCAPRATPAQRAISSARGASAGAGLVRQGAPARP